MIVKDIKTGKKKDVRLPKVFKAKWIKALRSGKFEQGQHYLQYGNEYCCLGVACRILNPKMKLGNKTLISSLPNKGKNTRVPAILREEENQLILGPVVEKLIKMNDNGKSFKVIANYISKHL